MTLSVPRAETARLLGNALKKIRKQLVATVPKPDVAPYSNFSESLEAQLYLFEKYPLFFRATRFPETYLSNLGYLGLQCGPGWFPAVEEAAATIENELYKLLERTSEAGVLVTVDRLLKGATNKYQLNEAEVIDCSMTLIPYCSEICEDNGMLRISIVNGFLCDGATWMAIRKAADRAIIGASHSCERCGQPGIFRSGYWCRVYCDECAAVNVAASPKPPRT